jgi:arylsulfatase A-like enzyme
MISKKLLQIIMMMLVVLMAHQANIFAQKKSVKPNIIFILADDFGYGDLGSYGQKLTKTPNLDQLAKAGTRFTQVYTSAPVCAPSRASLMTGKHQGHALIRGNNGKNGERISLRAEDLTIAEVLKTAGYRTGLVGKWGLGEPDTAGIPNKKGFDYFYGYLDQTLAHNYYPDYLWRNQEKVNLAGKSYSADLFTDEALQFISRESKNPFFLYLAITLPHANNELTRKTGNGMEIYSDAPYSNENWSQPNKNFAAMVTKMDTDVGKILALLKQLKIDDRTIVIFTGDNGPQGPVEGSYEATFFNSTGSLRGIKRSLYEGGIREPMIIRWPGKVQAGRVNNSIWSSYFLFPTLAEIAKAKIPSGLDGTSILPVWLGQQKPNPKFLYWEFYEGGFVQAVRLGNWKALRKGLNGNIELYDLQNDVAETKDLSNENPKIVAEISEIMKREHVPSANWDDTK